MASIFIDLNAISQNIKTIAGLCNKYGISITAVTKGALADQRVVRVLLNCGIKDIADSRLTNLKRIRKISDDIYLTLIRSPEIGEIEETLNIANCSFVSEVSTVEKISRVAMRKNLTHDIVVMFDLGDRREGFLPSEITIVLTYISRIPNIKIRGIGTNLGCISGVCYTGKKLEQLCDLASKAEKILGYRLEIISGGSTGALNLLYDGQVPKEVNNFRIGTAFF